MFDEQNDPVDIFAETENSSGNGAPPANLPQPQQSVPQPESGPVMKPVINGEAPHSRVMPPQIEASASRGPSKLIFALVVVVVLALVGSGVWYFLLRDSDNSGLVEGLPAQEDSLDDSMSGSVCGNSICDDDEDRFSCPADCPLDLSVCGDGICQADEGRLDCPEDCSPTPDEPVVPPEPANLPVDTDGDGLDDLEEEALGTNPQLADTDTDGLTDREEVRQYQSDPTNPDSDGDGYIDGEEVKAGYDPNGPGRLFALPQ